MDQFRIIAQVSIPPHLLLWTSKTDLTYSIDFVQVGQGGYGSVYLARRVDTGQVCALKKMKKATLAKMDEVRNIFGRIDFWLLIFFRHPQQVKHVLVERDILTATKTPWLVRLLYAFQDREHVYLAMVSEFCIGKPDNS